MKTEGEYAQSKYLKAHRTASVGVVLIGSIVFAERFGVGLAIRAFANFVPPLVWIWFSDPLADWAISRAAGWLRPRNADSAVRFVGWLLLLILFLRYTLDYNSVG